MVESTQHLPTPLAMEIDEQPGETALAEAPDGERPSTPAATRFWKQRNTARAQNLTLQRQNSKLETEVRSLKERLSTANRNPAGRRTTSDQDWIDSLKRQLANRNDELLGYRLRDEALQKTANEVTKPKEDAALAENHTTSDQEQISKLKRHLANRNDELLGYRRQVEALQKTVNEMTKLKQDIEASRLALDYTKKGLAEARIALQQNSVQQGNGNNANVQRTVPFMRAHIENQTRELRSACMKNAVLTGKVRQLESANTRLLLERGVGRSSSISNVPAQEMRRPLAPNRRYSMASQQNNRHYRAPPPAQHLESSPQQVFPNLDAFASRKRKYPLYDASNVIGSQAFRNRRSTLQGPIASNRYNIRAANQDYIAGGSTVQAIYPGNATNIANTDIAMKFENTANVGEAGNSTNRILQPDPNPGYQRPSAHPPHVLSSQPQTHAPTAGSVTRSASVPTFAHSSHGSAHGSADEWSDMRMKITPYIPGTPFPDLGNDIVGLDVARNADEGAVGVDIKAGDGDDGM